MGHKTSGSWDDVTSLGRNDIVFEGRNKAYGAYYVRQRYNYALLLGLLFSLSTVIVGSSVPILIKKIFPNAGPAITPPDKEKIICIITDYHPPVTPPKPPIKPPTNNIKPPQTSNNPPVVSNTPDTKDSDKTARDLNDRTVGTVDVPGTQTAQPPTPPSDPGPPTPPAPQIFKIAEIMPKFKGDFSDFISKNITYPAIYREANIEGTVYASFIIEPDGSVSSITILRGVAGADDLSTETINVLKKMPNWEPGQQNGHPVRVQLNLPVKFQVR